MLCCARSTFSAPLTSCTPLLGFAQIEASLVGLDRAGRRQKIALIVNRRSGRSRLLKSEQLVMPARRHRRRPPLQHQEHALGGAAGLQTNCGGLRGQNDEVSLRKTFEVGDSVGNRPDGKIL